MGKITFLDRLRCKSKSEKLGSASVVVHTEKPLKSEVEAFLRSVKHSVGFGIGGWHLVGSNGKVACFLAERGIITLDGNKQNFKLNTGLWQCGLSCKHYRARTNPYTYNKCEIHGNLSQMLTINHGLNCPDCLPNALASVFEECG